MSSIGFRFDRNDYEKRNLISPRANIDYELIVVEQLGHTPFNRGKLLNVGFKEAQSKRCDYVVFHDIDIYLRPSL